MDDDEIKRLCLPPTSRPDLPLTITNQLWKAGTIRDTISSSLSHPTIDTLIAVAPFISTYFIHFIEKTNLKNLVLLINRKDLNPDYVDDAVNLLKKARFNVHVRKRPDKAKFIHMKVLIPYIIHKGSLTPYCAMSGSVNFTKNGIIVSDEALFVFRDMYNINALIFTFDKLLNGSILVYSSSNIPAKESIPVARSTIGTAPARPIKRRVPSPR